jgi:hypothetical protein
LVLIGQFQQRGQKCQTSTMSVGNRTHARPGRAPAEGILQLQRAGISTASAEAVLGRMQPKSTGFVSSVTGSRRKSLFVSLAPSAAGAGAQKLRRRQLVSAAWYPARRAESLRRHRQIDWGRYTQTRPCRWCALPRSRGVILKYWSSPHRYLSLSVGISPGSDDSSTGCAK